MRPERPKKQRLKVFKLETAQREAIKSDEIFVFKLRRPSGRRFGRGPNKIFDSNDSGDLLVILTASNQLPTERFVGRKV